MRITTRCNHFRCSLVSCDVSESLDVVLGVEDCAGQVLVIARILQVFHHVTHFAVEVRIHGEVEEDKMADSANAISENKQPYNPVARR